MDIFIHNSSINDIRLELFQVNTTTSPPSLQTHQLISNTQFIPAGHNGTIGIQYFIPQVPSPQGISLMFTADTPGLFLYGLAN